MVEFPSPVKIVSQRRLESHHRRLDPTLTWPDSDAELRTNVMKWFLIYIILFLSLAGCVICQSNTKVYYIDNISELTDVNAILLHGYSNAIISWNKASDEHELACLRSQLLRTSLFRVVRTELKPTSPDHYNLLVTAKLRYRKRTYSVHSVVVEGYSNEIDRKVFVDLVGKSGLLNRPISLTYDLPGFRTKMIGVMREAFRQAPIDDRWLPVLVFRALKNRQVRLILVKSLNCN